MSKTAKKSLAEVTEAFNKVGLELTSTTYTNALLPLEQTHIECGHLREIQYGTVQKAVKANRQIICKVCGTSKKQRSTEQVSLEILEKYNLILEQEYTKIKQEVNVRHQVCNHQYKVNLEKLLYHGTGKDCLVCLDTTKKRFFTSLLNQNIQIDEQTYTTAHGKVTGTYVCGHTVELIPNNTVCAGSGLVCRICNPLPRDSSKPQREIFEYIKKHYQGQILLNDRTIFEGKEIDIYMPEAKLGIEFNGIYWHQDKFLESSYHKNKADLAEAKGIKLLQIFETEWLTKKDIVLQRIMSHLGGAFTLYARNCSVERATNVTQFLEENHLQGAGNISPINFALKYKGEIVAVMTFGTPRFNNNYQYELIRFCTLTGVRIIGGASKLLKAFRKQFSGQIISYADRRYSNGNLYKTLGFSYSHTSQPNYKYHKYKTIYTRYQCQKHLLKNLVPEHYSPELSESEIMRNAGFNKVYDAGNLVYTLL